MLSLDRQISEPLKIWEKLDIIVGEGEAAGKYVARVEDFSDNGILISEPIFVSGESLMRDGIWIMVLIVRSDASYQFASTIRKIDRDGSVIYQLSAPKRLVRVQRRQYVRIELIKNIRCAPINRSGLINSDTDAFDWHESQTADFSGGGVLMRVPDETEIKDLLLLQIPCLSELNLPDMMVGIVRRVIKQRDAQNQAGVQFIASHRLHRYFSREEIKHLPERALQFDQKAQNELVNYVFHCQIELRQKGLI